VGIGMAQRQGTYWDRTRGQDDGRQVPASGSPAREGWHHHMALTLIAVWFLSNETHRGQQSTPALTLSQVHYGLSVLLLAVFCTLTVDYICRHVHRRLVRNELARFYHYRTRNCMPPRKLRRDIQ